MDMQKHKAKSAAKSHPPAFYRYRENHPTISLVLTKELKDLLDKEKQTDDLSYSQLIMKFIKQQVEAIKARQEGYADGYAKAGQEAEKKRLDYGEKQYSRGFGAGKVFALKEVALGFCPKCHKPIFWDLTDPEVKREIDESLAKNGFYHIDCP